MSDTGDLTINITPLLTILTQRGITLGNGCDGSASVVVSPTDEISVSLNDGTGRNIASGILKRDSSALLTYSTNSYDTLAEIPNLGFCLEQTRTDALNHTTKSRTNAAGHPLQSIDQANHISTMTYNHRGDLLSSRDPASIGQDCLYDLLGRRTSCTDTQGDTTSTTYDLLGLVLTETDAKQHATTFTYDPLGRRLTSTDRINAVTTWTYDLAGHELTMTDAENQTTTYQYDQRGQKWSTTWPDHVANSSPGDTGYGITETTYDPAGRTLRTTDQLGDTVTYLYDHASRLTTREYRVAANSPAGQTESIDTFTYDPAGRLLTAQKGRYSNIVSFAYDEAGRTITEGLTAHNTNYTIGNTYDDNGRLTSISYPDGSVVNRTYTDRDQLATVEQNNTVLAAMTYNNSGRETSRTLGNGITTNFNYRNDGLLTAIDTVGISGADFVYTYDENKNLISEVRDDNMAPYSFTATYDDQNRLINWLRQNQESQSWDLSAVGDWTNTTKTDASANTNTETRTHGQTHELATINGNPLIHDVKGNLTTDHTNKSFTWDVDNHLKSATVPAVVGGSPDPSHGITGTHTYEYDALGRRIAKIVNDTANNTTTWTLYVNRTEPIAYSPFAGQTLMEYQWTSGQAAAVIRKFTYGAYIDEPITLTDKRVGADNSYYYHRNRQFSTVAMTNTTGSIIERYTYTAYGKPTCYDAGGNTLTIPITGNEYTYTGRQSDHETRLMYFRARYYSDVLGRFVSRDELNYIDGSSQYLAWFSYIDLDPSGKVREFLPINVPQIELDVPATPTKCAWAAFLLSTAGGFTGFVGQDDKLWKHYLGGTGKDMYLSMGSFDGTGGHRRSLESEVYKELDTFGMPGCGATFKTSGKVERQYQSVGSPMISTYTLTADYEYKVTKNCLFCVCTTVSYTLEINYSAYDRTDFNPGDRIPMPGIGYITDNLILDCHMGVPFDIRAKSKDVDSRIRPCF